MFNLKLYEMKLKKWLKMEMLKFQPDGDGNGNGGGNGGGNSGGNGSGNDNGSGNNSGEGG